ncbi:methyltransferase domain-containing protein [Salinibacterium sp. SYSU T00001]|uniref:methyltransferase domain-containing protein n=1 Tax=Homoserinimonas sedimenticola TaxID=2986805 RepID=UPI0022354CD6|nr:methyltransferase domain-containing protein [Salinibacterium sedimenticola]MCW4385139.1 methyltransferase domain-containing protein [Salinibacterium sedimenticola]
MHDLSTRSTHLAELMDDADCDRAALDRTYRRFLYVNAVVSGWRATYRDVIRPLLSATETRTLLDVGSGGGDLSRSLARWAARDGLRLEVTGVDPDPRAQEFAASVASPGVRFVTARAEELDEQFDFVISNHVLHHVDDLEGFLASTSARARVLTVHADIERSRFAYRAFATGTTLAWPALRGSFIRPDGLTSIRRAHRAAELRERLADTDWRVIPRIPAHYLLMRVSRARA